MKTLWKRLRQYGPLLFIQFAFAGFRLRVINRLLLGSYSQSKEDLILDTLTGKKMTGFYVDVGAYDPIWFSNTLRFYKRGWRGINIEPDTSHWKRFEAQRPRDINLNVGVGTKRGKITFYRMDPPALSTFSRERVTENLRDGFTIEEQTPVRIRPLKDIFSRYAGGKKIDFLSLDVEGMEMDVLRSNDWHRFRPKFLCIESSYGTKKYRENKRIRQLLKVYLTTQHYTLLFDNGLNAFYKDTHG